MCWPRAGSVPARSVQLPSLATHATHSRALDKCKCQNYSQNLHSPQKSTFFTQLELSWKGTNCAASGAQLCHPIFPFLHIQLGLNLWVLLPALSASPVWLSLLYRVSTPRGNPVLCALISCGWQKADGNAECKWSDLAPWGGEGLPPCPVDEGGTLFSRWQNKDHQILWLQRAHTWHLLQPATSIHPCKLPQSLFYFWVFWVLKRRVGRTCLGEKEQTQQGLTAELRFAAMGFPTLWNSLEESSTATRQGDMSWALQDSAAVLATAALTAPSTTTLILTAATVTVGPALEALFFGIMPEFSWRMKAGKKELVHFNSLYLLQSWI